MQCDLYRKLPEAAPVAKRALAETGSCRSHRICQLRHGRYGAEVAPHGGSDTWDSRDLKIVEVLGPTGGHTPCTPPNTGSSLEQARVHHLSFDLQTRLPFLGGSKRPAGGSPGDADAHFDANEAGQ
ncbi:hypothetical protein GCM10012287_49440 [Streptomyces daqingensis]|uniref:Uncharacterized protein n=1 Tax=Streptomyces daqingensis TaxID=1472640 RepID=A0ABQ2MR10_9ACTN|nr:hypothetical protein GCM10012287_49440 [Streptomyces daqingensis]